MSGEPAPLALVSLVRRNRRRYGGYVVHVGIALLFVGVAASTAFQHEKDARMRIGDTTTVGEYRVKYEKSTAHLDTTNDGRLEDIRFGAVLKVRRGDGQPFRVVTERRYFPATNAPFLGPVQRFFEGEATSEIGLRAGMLRDFWAAYQPDQENIRTIVDALDKRVKDAPPEQQVRAVMTLTAFLRDRPPAATFRLIGSPLVSWIWLGAIVVFCGGILALWPAPDAARRRATARAAARVAQDLGRA
jgi:cytochrome c-type biogenesis protein CcmF